MNRVVLQGSLPSPANPPKGCKFHTRCPMCMECCKNVEPKEKDFGNGHKVACHLYDEEIMKRQVEVKKEEEVNV